MSDNYDKLFNVDLGIAVVDRVGADDELSLESTNAVQNKAVTAALNEKQPKGDYVSASELDERLSHIEEQISDILYEPIEIKVFTANPSSVEIGSQVDEVTLSWALNKDAEKIDLSGETQVPTSSGSTTLSGLALTQDSVWSLTATDEREASAEKTASLVFLNGVYYGVAAAPEAYDSAFILTLTKNLRSSKLTSISVNAGAGQYIYYCLPKRFGACTFTVGGFTGGFTLADTIKFTNASVYTEDYYIYRSNNAGLGSTKVTIA